MARIGVPRLADACTVDVLHGDSLRRVGAAHSEPQGEEVLWEIGRLYPHVMAFGAKALDALRAGKTLVSLEISEASLRAEARDERHLSLLQKLGLCSAVVVPVRSGDGSLCLW